MKAKLHIISLEVLMLEDGIFIITNFMKAIHIELTNERQKIIMLEMLAKNLSGQSSHTFDHKRLAIRHPLNYLTILRILHKFIGTSTIL